MDVGNGVVFDWVLSHRERERERERDVDVKKGWE